MGPIIGVACTKMYFPNNHLDQFFYVGSGYVDGVARAGGIPLILPLLTVQEAPFREMIESLDGLILTGGDDPAPHLYGEEPLQGLGNIEYERDLAELAVIKLALELKKPILGICRGMQILNVACGGTLIQDIPSQVPGAFQHAQKGSRQYGAHKVTLKPGFLADALGQQEVLVNTSHHQAIKDVAPGFQMTACAADGVIEAIESLDGLSIGVQWHPERMWSHDSQMLKIAEAFIARVKQQKLQAK
ncbi:gamma-glutamyl-gamma-aminobutyrate hydrolase family protein [Brevibacillus agri]|uniref:gamma-glutamyl-gamma-aminobutyrate hydrolase family protein n=1 Tax=Brevibacillus agri TaxID=51101 RepID=UPI001C8DF089|nr:gamma-glutamyl-gamma-aminobutyrate hydrolase family protein [Brevibacillus agri]MBY0050231.1 gamma-glutamyl-gamma-aminobutyrate hydrolase family protein [Brevibacillus agri]MED1644311.1 gamma-glutamyl-gamma-aminobutyrate hydrolase family protein [Brevibacillus agri]MED1656431.1 gamma-glutamyl-gamma-aminobutyrate hydrolase family protein [Brevibacillus agri]MED1688297.1 gamma-glutamyl-gamma-aminobutyrate hydrolase family protein [Brevibacillus agri]MED1693490.1 gamma-glutamyl-gamma-aminobuty